LALFFPLRQRPSEACCGALKLAAGDALKHGPKGIWYRDVVRSRILATPPVKDAVDGP
jgi:hypothetical protein